MTQRTEGPGWLAGGGRMAQDIRAIDWSQTPLGPIESWPQSLRTTVSLCLASNFPISIAWGPQHTQIYNDGYWPICGAKHPRSMGQDFRECWASAWPAVGPAFERALAGETSFLENQRMFLDRNGYLEETFFTFSFSPIQDESGGVGGLFHPVTETTEKMLSERRVRVLRDVVARAGKAHTVDEVCALTLKTLADHELDLPFVLLYLLEEGGTRAHLAQSTGLSPGGPASPTEVELGQDTSQGWPLAQAVESGRAVLVKDVSERFGPVRCGPYDEPMKSALVLPLSISGLARPAGVLVAGVSTRLPLDDVYRVFYEMLAGAISAALSNAHAYQEERKRAEELAELDRAKTAFFSNISHEFRTPLTLMLGPLEDLLASRGLGEAERQELAVVHRNAGRLLRLVNTLLDFSRLEANRLEASYEPTDLASLTRELASTFRSSVERAGLTFTVDCPPLGQPVYVDQEMWEKIVLNLLSNAFKYTLHGDIRVRLRESEGHAVLEVADTGTGIPAEELPRLFARFHRVKGAQGRTHEGTGIGLALVEELTKLHGGEVRVTSTEGVGSTFTVSLPLGKEHLPAERLQAPRELASTGLGANPFVAEAEQWRGTAPGLEQAPLPEGKTHAAGTPIGRVLLADDNTDMREYVQRVLSSAFEVEAVPDGQAALEAVRARPPDLVLTDVMMPRLSGFGLLAALRGDERTRAIPVVMLSARAGEEASVEGLDAGADDYLVKPFNARELVARVRSNLELARMRRKIAHQEAVTEYLREAVQIRDDFLSVASHELKTPLAAFGLSLELLERDLAPDSRLRVRDRLLSAGRQVKRLHSLVETLLDVSQLASGRLVLHLEGLDLTSTVEEVVSRLEAELQRAGISVRLHHNGSIQGHFDRVRLAQVVTNLLQNAARYGQGKAVEVRVENTGGMGCITVVDHGMGIAAEDRARIFEKFERAVPARQFGGLGLGLWITRQIVEAHGGRIAVGDTPGGGATFKVELPLAESPPTA
ncbi:signal transduction histidine kinase [Archangium gephyra]|uniref:histidine kinase n=1 Tax=Archangium gephyra TaxID=48 RepID=A0AAC8QGS4_9BACT|nr:ATP-binding protein [Archangium gephyra]AKJ07443.1 Chemotaxis protein methyltransferase CheR [Archangium gephyra]REG26838.1 signal transduction histidine kinase [Archangium gephyra]